MVNLKKFCRNLRNEMVSHITLYLPSIAKHSLRLFDLILSKTHSPLLALRFCFLPHFVLCLIAWYHILQYDLHFFVYTLFWWNPSDWLLFCHVMFLY